MSPALLVLFLGLSQLPGEPGRPEPLPVEETDLIWFPPVAVVEATIVMADDHLEWLHFARDFNLSRKEEWDAWIAAAECSRRPWMLLNNVHFAATDNGKKRYLNFLRARLGNRAYYGGHMPSPLPLHYFREIK